MILRRLAIIGGVLLLVGAFLAGYWPEHQRNQALEARVATLEQQLAAARGELRIGRLLGDLLNLMQVASQQDYGQAQALSSRFFDGVREEAAAASDGRSKDALAATLKLRDAVTAALTRADPAVMLTLTEIENRLRLALGYPVAPAGTQAAAPGG
jgi:hypothetical protein